MSQNSTASECIQTDRCRLHKGHYTTIRKIDNQWWHCDDAGMGGNKRLTRAEVETHEDGCVFLLKRVDHEDEIDEAT